MSAGLVCVSGWDRTLCSQQGLGVRPLFILPCVILGFVSFCFLICEVGFMLMSRGAD